MAKKKKKLNKKLIHQKLRELESQSENQTKKEIKPQATTSTSTSSKNTKEKAPAAKIKQDDGVETYIRRDMIRVGIISLVIVIMFVILYLVNLKTNYIFNTGDWIFKILHVGQI